MPEPPKPPAVTAKYVGSDLWRQIDEMYVLAKRMGRSQLAKLIADYDSALIAGNGADWLETNRAIALALSTGAEVTGRALAGEIREVFTPVAKVNFEGVFE